MKFTTKLRKLNACNEAVVWAEQYKTWKEVWDNCERADWLLWIAGKMADKPGCSTRKEVVLVACKCARTALKHLPKDEKRPLKAIQTIERHSPDGFEWGYGGSGPCELSLNLVEHILQDLNYRGLRTQFTKGSCFVAALGLYYDFGVRFIESANRDGDFIPYQELRSWVEERMEMEPA